MALYHFKRRLQGEINGVVKKARSGGVMSDCELSNLLRPKDTSFYQQQFNQSQCFQELCALAHRAYGGSESWGAQLERRTKEIFNIKNKTDNTSGDGRINQKTIEVKWSLGGKERQSFNWVQLRPSHNIDFYFLGAYIVNKKNPLGKVFKFIIPAKELYALLPEYGGYAHGTIKEQGKITEDSIKNNTYEYALRCNIKQGKYKKTKGQRLWEILLQYDKSDYFIHNM